MPRSYNSPTLEDAKRMSSTAEAKAASLGIAYNIAIVDAGGDLVAFVRQDGTFIGSIDLALDKAVTTRIVDRATSDLANLAQSGKPLFGIQESNASKVVIFGGRIPVSFDGSIVAAVGASAGAVEQDIAVAEAAIAALGRPAQPSRRSRSSQKGSERRAQQKKPVIVAAIAREMAAFLWAIGRPITPAR
jgi:uncharacterized protein GlcG (DUF336 family)